MRIPSRQSRSRWSRPSVPLELLCVVWLFRRPPLQSVFRGHRLTFEPAPTWTTRSSFAGAAPRRGDVWHQAGLHRQSGNRAVALHRGSASAKNARERQVQIGDVSGGRLPAQAVRQDSLGLSFAVSHNWSWCRPILRQARPTRNPGEISERRRVAGIVSTGPTSPT